MTRKRWKTGGAKSESNGKNVIVAYDKSSERHIKPQQVIETLHKVTNGDAYVASDVGQHQMFAALYYPFDKPRRWINSGGFRHDGLWSTSRYGR